MSRVLLLNLIFPPDGVSTAQLLGEMATDFKAAGHDVSVLTTMPHYNRDSAAEQLQPIKRRFFGGSSDYDGITVRHLPMPPKASSGLLRMLQWMWFHAASAVAAWLSPRPDVIVATSPPLSIGANAWVAGRFGRVPFVLNVWEVYPDIAVQLGLVSNRAVISALSRLERATYKRAHSLTVTSDTARRTLVADDRTSANKVHVVPNFVDMAEFSRGHSGFGERHGLADEFVVTYAGNMGPAQHLDNLVDAAKLLPQAQVLLVGGGAEQQRLARRVADEGIVNCTVLAYQDYSEVPGIYAATSLGVVPLATGVVNEMPSKAIKLMAAGVALVAIAGKDSALADLVATTGCGIVVQPDRADLLAEGIAQLAENPGRMTEMGEAGRRHAREYFSRPVVMAQYLELISRAAQCG